MSVLNYHGYLKPSFSCTCFKTIYLLLLRCACCLVVFFFFLSVRDGKVRKSVERIFTIWEERSVYPEEVISQLKANLNKKEGDKKEREKPKEKEKETPPANGQF